MDQAKNSQTWKGLKIAEKRLPFINIDDLEDPVKTLKDGGYPDPDVLDFPSGGYYRKGSDVLDRLIDLELVDKMKINPKVAMSPADVPLGDGMIYEAKTQMQKNLKQKYDLMLQEGFIDEVEYKKQMDRHFGTKGKK